MTHSKLEHNSGCKVIHWC